MALANAVRPLRKAGRRDGKANARLLGQKACDGCGIAGILLMAKGNDADAGRLRHAAKIGDRNARHIVDGLDAIQLERVDDKMKPVGQFTLGLSRHSSLPFIAAADTLGLVDGYVLRHMVTQPQRMFANEPFRPLGMARFQRLHNFLVVCNRAAGTVFFKNRAMRMARTCMKRPFVMSTSFWHRDRR